MLTYFDALERDTGLASLKLNFAKTQSDMMMMMMIIRGHRSFSPFMVFKKILQEFKFFFFRKLTTINSFRPETSLIFVLCSGPKF